MPTQQLSYRDLLKSELACRQRRHPQYSLRAFARDIGISAPQLSDMLKGRCGISELRAKKMADRMKMSAAERELFVSLVSSQHARSQLARERARRNINKGLSEKFQTLDPRILEIVRDWPHFAIMELTRCESFRPDPKWMAKTLKLSEATVKACLENLFECGLLKSIEGQWRETQSELVSQMDIPSRAIRSFHSQLLAKADQELEETKVELREFLTAICAIDESDLPEMKTFLREFVTGFHNRFAERRNRNQVYALSLQLFPLSKEENPTSNPIGARNK